MSEAMFSVNKVGLYCESVTHATEKRKDGEVKVVVLKLRVQPFDPKLATAMRDVVRTTLFRLQHPDPHPHLERVHFNLGIARQNLEIFATPDTTKASIAITQVRIDSIYARTGSGQRGYALSFKAISGPPSAKELAFVEDWRNTMRYASFTASEYQPEFDVLDGARTEDDDEEDDKQLGLPATDGPGHVDESQAAAADSDEPVRQRLKSHTGGRGKQGPRTH